MVTVVRGFPIKFAIALFVAVGVLASAPGARAETLYEAILDLVKNHKQIRSKEAELTATQERLKAAWGDWYPTLDITGSYGREKQNKTTGTLDTEEVPRELDIKVTQMIWDFGAINAVIRRNRLSIERARTELILTRQALILQGVESHLNVIKAKKVLGFAAGSVANIRRQAELEDSRVQRGGGFTTDLLQAKTQLAGAEARRNNFADEFRQAQNEYRRFFQKEPGKIEDMEVPRTPFELLPKTVEEVVQITLENNPELKSLRLLAAAARETVKETRADEFFPTLKAIAETKKKSDVAGTIGDSTEQLFKLELTYSLNLGLTQLNTLRATKQDHLSLAVTHADDRDAAEQDARNLWSELEKNRSNVVFLKNQANIAAEFLELARRERQLGTRSLIDVLAGETALINANSDATARETDVIISVFRIIAIMGKLETDVLKYH